MYKAVIFDLDGTLIHTLPEYRYNVVGKTLIELGGVNQKRHIDQFWFGADRTSIIKKNFKLKPELFWETYRRNDKQSVRKRFTKAYDDAHIVKDLRKHGFSTGIVTGAPPHIAALEIAMIGKRNFDSIILVNDKEIKRKPHPQGLQNCLKDLGINHKEAVYVGNAGEDILMAQKAKVLDILIKRGEHVVKEKPSLKINTLAELGKVLAADF